MTFFLFIELIHSPGKSGTTFWPQALTRETSHWPQLTRLLVTSSLPKISKVVFSKSPKQTVTTVLSKTLGEDLSSKLTKSKVLIAIPTSTVWTSPEIRHAQWSRSGTHSLNLSYKPKPLTDILSECSASPSPRRQRSKLRPHATPRLLTRSSSEERWWKLCNLIFKRAASRILSRACKYFSVIYFYVVFIK